MGVFAWKLTLLQKEVADMRHGVGGFFGGEHLKYMPHVLVNLKGAGDVRFEQLLMELLGVGIQDLVGAHLDQRGREAGKIAQQGRKIGVVQILLAGIGAADGLDIIHGQHGVDLLPLGVGGAGGGHHPSIHAKTGSGSDL